MSSPVTGLLPCDSRQTSYNGISSITSGVQVKAPTVSPVPSSYGRVRNTWTKEIKIFSRNLQHNQFWQKSTTMTIEWHPNPCTLLWHSTSKKMEHRTSITEAFVLYWEQGERRGLSPWQYYYYYYCYCYIFFFFFSSICLERPIPRNAPVRTACLSGSRLDPKTS